MQVTRGIGTLLTAITLLLVPAAPASRQLPDGRLLQLRNVFEKSSTPAGVLVPAGLTWPGTGAAGDTHPLLRLDRTITVTSGLTYVVFRAQDDVRVPCSRSLTAGCCTFEPDTPYAVEAAATRRTAVLGTPSTTKAKWVRVVQDANLAALGVTGLQGTPVVAAFDQAALAGARYVVLSRRRRWRPEPKSDGRSCGGHVHMQATWAVLPEHIRDLRD